MPKLPINKKRRNTWSCLLVALLFSGCVALPGSITPVLTPTPWATPTPEDAADWTATPTPALQRGIVVAPSGLNVRTGPGVDYPKLGPALKEGQIVLVISNNDDGTWLQIEGGGWVSAAWIRLE